MTYIYLPQNTNSPISLENIAQEFNPVVITIDSSVSCETVSQSWLVSASWAPAFTLNNKGICWGGENGQYIFVIDSLSKAVLRFDADDARPTGISSSYHWNSNLDNQDIYSINLLALSIGNSTGYGPNTTGISEVSPQGISFSPDGLTMIIVGDGNGVIQYTLTTAWDITTASYTRKFSLTSTSVPRNYREYAPTDCWFATDGSKLFVAGAYRDAIHIINLPNKYSLAGAVYNNLYKLVDETGTKLIDYVSSVCTNRTGTKMYVSGYIDGTVGYVYEYKLEVANDPTSAIYLNKIDISLFSTNPTSVTYAPYGTVANHPTAGAGVVYDIGENLVILSNTDGILTLELPPPPPVSTPISFRDYFRKGTYVPNLEYTQNIPEEFDKTKLNGFVDSSIARYTLAYSDSSNAVPNNYLTNGFDFSKDGDYIFTNNGTNEVTVIFRHQLDSAFNVNTTIEDSTHQLLSIADQKIGGIAFDIFLDSDNGTHGFSHSYDLVSPANDSDALLSNYTTQPNNRIKLIDTASTETYQGFSIDNLNSYYKISGYVGSNDTTQPGNTTGLLAALERWAAPGNSNPTMKAFIVYYTHPDAVAFSGSSYTSARSKLENLGYTVTIQNLYSDAAVPSDIGTYDIIFDMNVGVYANYSAYNTTNIPPYWSLYGTFLGGIIPSPWKNAYNSHVRNGKFLYLEGNSGYYVSGGLTVWKPRNDDIALFLASNFNISMTHSVAASGNATNINSTYLPSVDSYPGYIELGLGSLSAPQYYTHKWTPTSGVGLAAVNSDYILWAWIGKEGHLDSNTTGAIVIAGSPAISSTSFASAAPAINDIVNGMASGVPKADITLSIERNQNGGLYPFADSNIATINSSQSRTFGIYLNANKRPMTVPQPLDLYNAPSTTLLSGGIIGDICEDNANYNNWTNSTIGEIQSYIEVIKESDEFGIYISPLTAANNWDNVSHLPGNVSQGEWDWRNLNEDSNVNNLVGIGYYLNVSTGEYKYRDWSDNNGVISGSISNEKIRNSLSELANISDYGVSAYKNAKASWTDFNINGLVVRGGLIDSDYQDIFASHKVGANGLKLFVAANNFKIATNNLFESKILCYDLNNAYDLSNYSYNNDVIYTYDSNINGKILSFDFGVDSNLRDGGILYTLNEPKPNANPNVLATLRQYKLKNTFELFNNISKYSVDITDIDLRYTPTTMTMIDNGNKVLIGGYNNGVYITLATLTEPYQINTLSIVDDSINTIQLTGINNLSSIYVSPEFDKLVISGTDENDSNNKLFTYENIGFLNPISFDMFVDSI